MKVKIEVTHEDLAKASAIAMTNKERLGSLIKNEPMFALLVPVVVHEVWEALLGMQEENKDEA